MIRAFRTRLAVAIGAATLIVGLTAGATLAGEVTGPPGKGGYTPIGAAPDDAPHAHSICSFSGLGDGEDAPGRTAAHVQNWGQITQEMRAVFAAAGAHPGDACNGHRGFFAGSH